MGRTVSYSVVKRNNPLDQDAVPKFYAQAQANGHVEKRRRLSGNVENNLQRE